MQTHNAKFEALSISEMREHHCVYVQELMPDEQIFYAGVCKLQDVMKCPDAYRNTHWRATVTDETVLKTTVIMSSHRIAHCYDNHNFFIKQYSPICNVKGYAAAGKAMITCLEGPNKGQSYVTQEECALKNGISQPSLSNHLNGRPGYLVIRGMKFKRGMP